MTKWKQVEALFERALKSLPAERAQFLQAISDQELRAEVNSLLQAHGQTGDFLDEPDRFLSSQSLDGNVVIPGQVIDRYRIIREIGRGGMGAVFLAERTDEYKKPVALKLIKRGMDTDSVLRHFQNERQILAGFDHPNIARWFDGGTTDDGLPYFVMEYIEGLPIDDYCSKQTLPIVERLKLFREVCSAVSYAHRRLVVHRDIKRSNILVTKDGVPKLLDFGIAKILQTGDGDGAPTFATMTGQRLMTPEYASPEQVLGQPVTTATDVYSLGVILYELLTGQFPYRFPSQTPRDIEHAISTTLPEKPSTAVAKAENPKSEIQNPKSLRGDLDNIVLMALRKEPERRYQSVEQFSEDIRRHLEGRPVLARKDTFGYRSGKFVRRNKAALAAAALLILILIGGMATTSHQARIATEQKTRAERRFNDVRKLANSVLFDYHDAIKTLPGATKVREQLVKDALTYLDSLAGEAHDDPALRRELAAAYERVGDVRGGESSGSLGDLTGAMQSYTKALQIREELLRSAGKDLQGRRDLANSHFKIGRLQHTMDATSGSDHLQKALALYLDLAREEPANDDLQLEVADVRNELGRLFSNHSDFAGALDQHRNALAICEKLTAANPRNQRVLRGLYTSQQRIAYAAEMQGDTAGAIAATDKELATSEALLAADPMNTDYQRCVVLSYQHGGNVRHKGDKRGALEFFRKAAALEEKMLAADPANALIRKDLAKAHKRIAEMLVDLGDYSEALVHYRKALEIFQKVVADAPTDLVIQFGIDTCRGGLAGVQAKLGEVDLALAECRKARAHLQQIIEDKDRPLIGRAQAYTYVGYAYRALADSSKVSAAGKREHVSAAREMFRQSQDVLNDLRSRSNGTLGTNEDWAREMAAEIAKCDAALN